MDPIQKTQNQVQNPTAGPGITSQPVQPVPPSAGTVHKEQGPVVSISQTSEFIKPSESEPQISQELKEIGVESVSHIPTLTEEHRQAGIYHAKESVPVPTEPTGSVQLPMSQAQAQSVLKLHKKVSDSIVWLAALILKQFKMVNSKL